MLGGGKTSEWICGVLLHAIKMWSLILSPHRSSGTIPLKPPWTQFGVLQRGQCKKTNVCVSSQLDSHDIFILGHIANFKSLFHPLHPDNFNNWFHTWQIWRRIWRQRRGRKFQGPKKSPKLTKTLPFPRKSFAWIISKTVTFLCLVQWTSKVFVAIVSWCFFGLEDLELSEVDKTVAGEGENWLGTLGELVLPWKHYKGENIWPLNWLAGLKCEES